jgi:cytochrome c553
MKKISLIVAVLMSLSVCGLKAEEAKANWEGKCAGCHGKEGKGDTKLGQKMGVKDYTDAKVQEGLKDEAMFKSIKEGVKKDGKDVMKPYAEKLSDDEIKALVAYIREFKAKK